MMKCIHYNGGYCSLAKNFDGINSTCNENYSCPDRKWDGDGPDWEKLKQLKGTLE